MSGTPQPRNLRKSLAKRIDVNTIKVEDHWLWIGMTNEKGYGRIKHANKRYGAHRVSAFLYLGLLLEDETTLVLHKLECMHKNCINPDHLYLGSHDDNMRDYHNFVSNQATFKNCGHPREPNNEAKKTCRGKVITVCKTCRYKRTQKNA